MDDKNKKRDPSWQELKDLIQSIKPADFEELIATLLTSFLKIPFVVARSGDQSSGDARDLEGKISMQAKRYTGKRSPNAKTVDGDIREAIRKLPHLQVYVLAISRDTAQLHDTLDAVSEETGLDIVILELTDDLSDLGTLCITFWEDLHDFFDSSAICQDPNFLAWVEEKKDSATEKKIRELHFKLKQGIQTQTHVQKDIERYLLKHFSRDQGFNPVNLSQAIERESLESKIMDWWTDHHQPVCCLEGREGRGKSWLAAKAMSSICENENIVAFWLDSKDWEGAKSIFDLLYTCFRSIYPSYEEGKITKLQNKSAKIWRKTLIVLDGVNERNALKAAQRILTEYFRNDESEWKDRVHFLFTTRPLDDYPDFENYLWDQCREISVGAFSDLELQEALNREGLQLNDLPDSLKKEVARIPRYFQTCIRLRNQFRSFNAVTKEMVLWADLLDKIERTDPQIKQKLGWHRAKDAQEILSDLAKHAKWTNAEAGPQASVQLLEKYFPDYREVRHDLEERGIAIEAGLLEVKLSENHIKLGWALYLANLFDCTEFTKIKDTAEGFQNALEPIPSEDLRTEALFVALQTSDISPPDISQDQLSQKRAALMLAWFKSHNAQITDERLSFWAEKDPDAYAQVVEFEFEYHDSSNYEEALIKPLAKTWLNKKGDLNRLASRLTKWLLPTYTDDTPEDLVYTHVAGQRLPREKDDVQHHLLNVALSILSQRPERQFLKTLARCYAILHSNTNVDDSGSKLTRFYEEIGKLMRWGYTEEVLGDLHWLAELAQGDEALLSGTYGVADHLRVDLPPDLKRPLTEEDRERRTFAEEWNRRFKPYMDRIRDREKLLTGESPADNIKGNYHGLGYLAVRTDLPGLHHEDLVEIKRVLRYIAMNAKLGQSAAMTLEDSCIDNLLPWVAKYDPESYAEFACSLKLNALNQGLAQLELSSIQGLIFKPEDRVKIIEAILGIKEYLTQDKDFYSDVEWFTSLLTEILLFSASEDKLADWFEFLSTHEPLRISIGYEPLPGLLKELLPKSIMRLARQKLETLRLSDNQTPSNGEQQEFSEEEFWCALYAYSAPINEETVGYALTELKMREPDSTGTFPMLRLALSDPKQFLDEMLIDEKMQRHLFSEHGRQFIVHPYDKDENIPPYEVLRSFLPQEIIGSFLCKQDRQNDLSRWGKELIRWLCSILQGNEGDFDYNSERRFWVDTKVLRTWAEQNTTDFLRLADEYLIELSKSPWSHQELSHFTDAILCLLLRFQPDEAMKYYRQWKAKGFRTVYSTQYGIETFFDQLWQVKECDLPEHRTLRRELLEDCLNDEEIMLMTLAALAGKGEKELWNLVIQEYLRSPYAKERNLGVSILPWFGTNEAIKKLKELKSDDKSLWVREHAAWAYEVAQQEQSCREVYQKVLQTRDLFKISAVFEQIKPALLPTARWWCEIEHKKFREESQDINPKLAALVDRFWYRWGNFQETKRNIEVFRRKLREYCRGEKLSAVQSPRIAPWWKPSSEK